MGSSSYRTAMAETKRNAMLIAETRSRVQTSQLVNRLQDHGFGKIELSTTQIKAIEILLRKSMPDLQSVQIGGDPGNPIGIDVKTMEQKQAEAKALLAETFGEKRE